ncbi:hypothetical protein FAZ98_22340 [Paraburkholderia acidisoli]|uniref:Integrase-like protein n=1 Tax=Paraburkholderia acidisoli TaxID=2571748 RepID=A0A7Z2JIP7_9BURK|nr:hypothetical protein FAZ98_22340 [Paraburkholderia acidisoli]
MRQWNRRFTRDARATDGTLIHHSDRGCQYVSIRYSERLAEAGIEPSVGSYANYRYTTNLNIDIYLTKRYSR